ncbi:putative F-box protein At1g65770 [Trifolium pratense]|uniref:putative F-box protein At1g65770 n=1 Tax=Trifolium pratense TaxID=57577 RepID=UPI001E69611D|nr:putative F-box protein At1g65770 [Trifolium pratense]
MISLFSKLNIQKKQKSFTSHSSSTMDDKVDWSQLPIELWPKIGKYLDNHIDVLRFRSVCESFRSSIPHSLPNSPSFPLQIPHPINISLINNLNQLTVYLIQPTDASSNSNLESLATCSSSKGWLIKVEESRNQPLRLLSPVSDRKLSYPLSSSNNSSVMLWNLMDYRVIELCKSYTIEKATPTRFSSSVIKVVFYPNSPWTSVEDCVSCCVFQEGKLGFMKHGDKQWKLVDEKNFYYDDVIVFKGQFYVTDKWGTISWIDVCSFKLVQFSPPLCGFGNKKHLVESCGSLYVVDRYYESNEDMRRNYVGRRHDRHDQDAVVECFKVYKLDEEWGKWVDVKNLKDRAFILSKSCNFSVSTKELIGYQGNCIYFRDAFDVRMYNLDDHSVTTVDFNPCIDKTLWSRSPWMRC